MLLSYSENREHLKNLIVYWPLTIKFRIRKQTSKPQTNYHCCLRFSYLVPYWLISGNTITFHKYFWCSRFCEFHSKSCFILSLFKVMLLSGKDKGKTGTVTEVVRSKNWVFVEGLNTVSKLVSKWDVWGLEVGFRNNYIVGVIIIEGLNVKLSCVNIWSWKFKLLRMSWIFAWSFHFNR